MAENREYLVTLDQQNGDGDLGITMSDGYGALAAWLATSDEADLGKALMRCSSIFNEKAPSTLGTITSLFLMAMAKSLKGKTDATLTDLAVAMDAGLAQVMEKAKSKPGEKTILDSVAPAVEALKAAAARAPDGSTETELWNDALSDAARAAAAGSEATRTMRSVHGRAAYYGDKSIGIIDGGSVVGRLVFESIAKSRSENDQ
jgi:dihydroxyacetone kinase-like protein